MSDGITEHVHYERGYNKGFEEGRKRAFDLVGELADFYKNNIGIDESVSEEEKAIFKKGLQHQVNACRYAQHVIRKNEFGGEEELPW